MLLQELLKVYTEHNSIPRIGQPDDVAREVAYFTSDQAEFISSISLLVDGDMLACSPEGSF